jgi:hypothetical protein
VAGGRILREADKRPLIDACGGPFAIVRVVLMGRAGGHNTPQGLIGEGTSNVPSQKRPGSAKGEQRVHMKSQISVENC